MDRSPLSEAAGVLLCPVCGEDLEPEPGGGALRCGARHSFDIAKQGYAGLLAGGGGSSANADTAAMVQARSDFLGAGHYAPLARELGAVAERCVPGAETVLDAGAGTGYYLAAVLDALPGARGLGLDVSKFAARRLAKAHPRAAAATWDVWRPLPVRDGSADVLLNVFAPRNGAEFRRVLRPGGALLVVTPTARHLGELREHAGLLQIDAAKEERLHRTLSGHFAEESAETLEYAVTLAAADVERLVGMGPAAHHLAPGEIAERAAGLAAPVEVTASFRVGAYRPR
ncbi:putative RNA methyltransferase [Streptomyces sp. ODS28]|uniref:putative RNA methyltransferase n=1 Tax=Streptomyces sp. ODS28 TaxID=3136688 RepID=UPI0031E9EBC3